MLPVGRKPMLQWVVEEAAKGGIKDILIITNNKKEMIKKYFSKRNPYVKDILDTVRIDFTYQKEPLGLGDAIGEGKEWVKGEPFALMLPDNIIISKTSQLLKMINSFKKFPFNTRGIIAINREYTGIFGNAGRIDGIPIDDNRIVITRHCQKKKGFIRKGSYILLKAIGRAILTPQIFCIIKDIKKSRKRASDKDIDDYHIFKELHKRGEKIIGFRIGGTVFDVGTPEGLSNCLSFIHK